MNQSFKNALTFLTFFCLIVGAFAQEKTITGTVSDKAGQLPG